MVRGSSLEFKKTSGGPGPGKRKAEKRKQNKNKTSAKTDEAEGVAQNIILSLRLFLPLSRQHAKSLSANPFQPVTVEKVSSTRTD